MIFILIMSIIIALLMYAYLHSSKPELKLEVIKVISYVCLGYVICAFIILLIMMLFI